ncbi:MAG: sarcosine oxidase subunit delta [Chloroflexi bacterium]|nr:sarcosine oxidase subunit delta [Chloroflexota bacterium]
MLNCPNCGQRNVYDFRFGGEVLARPEPGATNDELTAYLYSRENADGPQREWWIHSLGCRKWFIAVRNTHTNEVIETAWPPEAPLRTDEAADGH